MLKQQTLPTETKGILSASESAGLMSLMLFGNLKFSSFSTNLLVIYFCDLGHCVKISANIVLASTRSCSPIQGSDAIFKLQDLITKQRSGTESDL